NDGVGRVGHRDVVADVGQRLQGGEDVGRRDERAGGRARGRAIRGQSGNRIQVAELRGRGGRDDEGAVVPGDVHGGDRHRLAHGEGVGHHDGHHVDRFRDRAAGEGGRGDGGNVGDRGRRLAVEGQRE